MSKRATNSWGDEKPYDSGGAAMQLGQYVVLAVAIAIFSIVLLVGGVVYMAMIGNQVATLLLVAAGVVFTVLLSIVAGFVGSWATMAVNQSQDERAANQQIKYAQLIQTQTQLIQNQTQFEANKQWQERFATLAAGYKMSQHASKAEVEQQKIAGGYKTVEDDTNYLEVDGIEISL